MKPVELELKTRQKSSVVLPSLVKSVQPVATPDSDGAHVNISAAR